MDLLRRFLKTLFGNSLFSEFDSLADYVSVPQHSEANPTMHPYWNSHSYLVQRLRNVYDFVTLVFITLTEPHHWMLSRSFRRADFLLWCDFSSFTHPCMWNTLCGSSCSALVAPLLCTTLHIWSTGWAVFLPEDTTGSYPGRAALQEQKAWRNQRCSEQYIVFMAYLGKIVFAPSHFSSAMVYLKTTQI